MKHAAFSFGCYGRLPHAENNNITLDFVSDDIGFLIVVIYHNTLNESQYVYNII